MGKLLLSLRRTFLIKNISCVVAGARVAAFPGKILFLLLLLAKILLLFLTEHDPNCYYYYLTIAGLEYPIQCLHCTRPAGRVCSIKYYHYREMVL